MNYLERDELRFVLASVDHNQTEARRDLALLCLAYNSGGRAQELADVRVDGLRLRDPATVRLWGKGRKERELLQSGVDLVTIQNWLGHRSPETVHTYLALDLKSRRDLLERCLDLGDLLPAPDTDPDWLSDL
ncbi:MAG: site-specific integrase [Candidatus Xenobia bacterium]